MSDDTIDPPVDAEFEALIGRLMTEATAEVQPSLELERRVTALTTTQPARRRRGFVAAATLTAAAMIGLVVWWQQDDGTVVTTPAEHPPSLWDTVGTGDWTELPLPPMTGLFATKAYESGLLAVESPTVEPFTQTSGWPAAEHWPLGAPTLFWLGADRQWVRIAAADDTERTLADQVVSPVLPSRARDAGPNRVQLWLTGLSAAYLATIDVSSGTYTTESFSHLPFVGKMLVDAPDGNGVWYADGMPAATMPGSGSDATFSFTAVGPDASPIPPLVIEPQVVAEDGGEMADEVERVQFFSATIAPSPRGTPIAVTSSTIQGDRWLVAWELVDGTWTKIATSPRWDEAAVVPGLPMTWIGSAPMAMVGPDPGHPDGPPRLLRLRVDDASASWEVVAAPGDDCPLEPFTLTGFYETTTVRCPDGAVWLDGSTWRALPRQTSESAWGRVAESPALTDGSRVVIEGTSDPEHPGQPAWLRLEVTRLRPGG